MATGNAIIKGSVAPPAQLSAGVMRVTAATAPRPGPSHRLFRDTTRHGRPLDAAADLTAADLRAVRIPDGNPSVLTLVRSSRVVDLVASPETSANARAVPPEH